MWLFLKSQLDMVLQDFDLSQFEIRVVNKRVKYPTAEIYPNINPPLIVVTANKPSLIRYALSDLLLHEKSHYDYMKYCETKKVCECVDHHGSVVFKMIDEGNKNLLTDLICEEHD